MERPIGGLVGSEDAGRVGSVPVWGSLGDTDPGHRTDYESHD